MSQPTSTSDLAILVLGHSRPWALRCVLEGLAREGALEQTEVWLDGHSAKPKVRELVLASQSVAREYPVARVVAYESAVGHDRRMFEALSDVLERASRVLVLEDDCFPAPGAIRAMADALDAIADDPRYFSIYGDPFGFEDESDGTWLFRPLGWATTREKLVPHLSEMMKRLQAPELAHRAWMRELVAAHPPDQPFLADGQMRDSDYLGHFQWDAVLPLLLARAGQRNLATGSRVLWNFGVGYDSWHLQGTADVYFGPPFNMVSPLALCERFNLEIPELANRFDVELDRTYRFVSNDEDARLLTRGWGGCETWGTWAVESAAELELCIPRSKKGRPLRINMIVRTEVTPEVGPVVVHATGNDRSLARWTFHRSRAKVRRTLTVPSRVLGDSGDLRLRFQIAGAASPASRGLSPDRRPLAFGLAELCLRTK